MSNELWKGQEEESDINRINVEIKTGQKTIVNVIQLSLPIGNYYRVLRMLRTFTDKEQLEFNFRNISISWLRLYELYILTILQRENNTSIS